jgi:S-formylglutathione hydrolase FrmB
LSTAGARARLAAAVDRHDGLGIGSEEWALNGLYSDEFLATQLKPELFEAACRRAGYPLAMRRHEGYGHGYWFISTFMGDHLRHHAEGLDA